VAGPDRSSPPNGFPDGGNGAGILLKRVNAFIVNSVFENNEADGNGIIYEGSPQGDGGAIFAVQSSVWVANTLFFGNSADGEGAALAGDDGVFFQVYFSTFFANRLFNPNWGASAISGWHDPLQGHTANTLTGYGNIFWQNEGGVGEVELAVQGGSRSSFTLSDGSRTSDNSLRGNVGINVVTGDPKFRNPGLLPGDDGQWFTEDDGLRLRDDANGVAYRRVPGLRPSDSADLDEDGNTTEPLPFDILGYEFIGTNFQAGAYQELFTDGPGMSPGVWDFGSGNYSLGAGEGLLLELGGTEDSLYDRIFARAGSVTLDGIVNLMFWGAYSGPVAGSWDTFDLVWAQDGIVLGNNLQVHFLQAGYQLETKMIGKDGGQLWQARIRQALVATPVEAAVQANPRLTVSHSPGPGGESEIFYTYRRPSGGGSLGGIYQAAGVRYLVEVSSDLRHWSPAPTSEITTLPEVEGWEAATVLVRGPAHKGFVRLRTEPAN
jgi:hypothetical protein